MKNRLWIFVVVLVLTSCAKDSFDANLDDVPVIPRSEISVTVTSLSYDASQCQSGCINHSGQQVNPVTDALVDVYAGHDSGADQQLTKIRSGATDPGGKILFGDLEPGPYTLQVTTSTGQKTRRLYTQRHQRSFIEFSF